MSNISEALASGLDWLSMSLPSIRRRQRDRNAHTARDNSTSSQGVRQTVDGDGDTDDRTKAGDAAAREAFMQLLVGHGISPEEFRALLIAGLGKADRTTADRQNVPSGVVVDTLL